MKRSREFPNVVDGSIKRLGRNRIAVNFHAAKDANAFIDSPTLLNNSLKAFVPTFNITKMGIVRGVPVELSPEEIVENVRVPSGCGPAIKSRRLNYSHET